MAVPLRQLAPDLFERERSPGLEQQGDEVHQAFERVHGRGIILSAMWASPPTRGSVRLRHATVLRIRSERPGVLELDVVVDEDPADPPPVAEPGLAVAFTQLVGPVEVGDRVLVNTTGVALGLGTGGFHLVVAVDDQTPTELDHPGRVMKARYTPLQVAVQSVEETDREALERSVGLRGRPVVCAPLHSMMRTDRRRGQGGRRRTDRLRDVRRSRAPGSALATRSTPAGRGAAGRVRDKRPGLRG